MDFMFQRDPKTATHVMGRTFWRWDVRRVAIAREGKMKCRCTRSEMGTSTPSIQGSKSKKDTCFLLMSKSKRTAFDPFFLWLLISDNLPYLLVVPPHLRIRIPMCGLVLSWQFKIDEIFPCHDVVLTRIMNELERMGEPSRPCLQRTVRLLS